MITNKEIKDCLKLRGVGYTKGFLPEIADLHISKKILNILEVSEKGSPKYNALKKYIDFFDDLFFIGNRDKPLITREEGELLKDIPNANDELIEEYRKRVDEIIKEME